MNNDRVKQFFDRWKTDYDFKTVTAALGSLFVTALFAIYNGFLGVYHASLWHGSVCVYYLVLVGLRTMIITARKNADQRAQSKRAQTKVYVASAVLLLLLNLCLVVPVSLMVVQKKPVDMTLIPAIATAAYTTCKVIMASVNLKRRKDRRTDSFACFDDRLHRRARVRSHVAKHAYHGKYEKRKFGNADFVCNHERRDHACGACVVLLRYDELD